MLNLEKLSILLIGKGGKLLARKNKLIELGAKNLTIFDHHTVTLPKRKWDIVMMVDLDEDTTASLYKEAKAMGALVNVEDQKEYCDFFFQSFVQRGNLLISVSSKGKSPGTVKVIRDKIEEMFPEIWGDRIEEIAKLRDQWKQTGLSYDQVNQKTKDYIKDNNWLE